jgi:hypothetical protein
MGQRHSSVCGNMTLWLCGWNQSIYVTVKSLPKVKVFEQDEIDVIADGNSLYHFVHYFELYGGTRRAAHCDNFYRTVFSSVSCADFWYNDVNNQKLCNHSACK